jgi:hypothetical protein
VEVKDRLSGAGADVEDGAVSLLDVALAGDLRGGEVTAADDFGIGVIGFFQSSEMFLGDDEDVRGRFGADVFEGEDMVVFVNFLGGNLAADDAAEKAVGISHGLLSFYRMAHRVKGMGPLGGDFQN